MSGRVGRVHRWVPMAALLMAMCWAYQPAQAAREWRCYSPTHGYQYHDFSGTDICWASNNNEDVQIYARWWAVHGSGDTGGSTGCTGTHGGSAYLACNPSYGTRTDGWCAYNWPAGGNYRDWGPGHPSYYRWASSIWITIYGNSTGTCRGNHNGSANCTASSIYKCLWGGQSKYETTNTWTDTTNFSAGNWGTRFRVEYGGDDNITERGNYYWALYVFDITTAPTVPISINNPSANTDDSWQMTIGNWTSITYAAGYEIAYRYCTGAGSGCAGWDYNPAECTGNGYQDGSGTAVNTTCYGLRDHYYHQWAVRAYSQGNSGVKGTWGYSGYQWAEDRTAPSSCQVSSVVENGTSSWVSGNTLYYNNTTGAGNFTVTYTTTDGYSPIERIWFPNLTSALGGFGGGGSDYTSAYQWNYTYNTGSSGSDNPVSSGNRPYCYDNPSTGSVKNYMEANSNYGIVLDTTAPANNGSISYTAGWRNASTYVNDIPITAVTPTDATAGIDGGGSNGNPHQIQLRTGTLNASGNCTGYGGWGTVHSYYRAAGSSYSGYTYTTNLSDNTCYQFQVIYYDNVDNSRSYAGGEIKVDRTAPSSCTLASISESGNYTHETPANTIWYSALAGGSNLTPVYTGTDDHSFDNIDFPALGVSFSGVAGSGTDSAAPYQNTYTVNAGASGSENPVGGANRPTCYDTAGNGTVASSNYSLRKDSTGPSGHGFTAPYDSNLDSSNVNHTITWGNGSDSESDMNAGSGAAVLVQRRTGTLSGGSCSSWSGYSTIVNWDTALPTSTSQSGLTTGCYQYRLQVRDNVQNTSSYAYSGELRIDVTPPTCAISTVNESGDYTWVSGTTAYYSALVAGSTFTPVYTASDAEGGVNRLDFPALGSGISGITGSGSDTTSTYTNTYTVTASGAGSQTPVVAANQPDCVDNAGNSAKPGSNYSVVKDTTAPTGGSITYANEYRNASTYNSTVPIDYDMGTDAAAGINAGSGASNRQVIEYQTATLSAAGTCGAYGGYTNLTTLDLGASATGTYNWTTPNLSDNTCYKFRLTVYDNVHNLAYYTSGNEIKVDRVAPTVCAWVSFSESSPYWYTSGTTAYYSDVSTGSLTVTYSMTDDHAEGSVNFPALGGIFSGFSGSGSDSSSPYTVAYTTGPSNGSGAIAGANRPTCYDAAGNGTAGTSNYTLTEDTTGPASVAFTAPWNGVQTLTATGVTVQWSNGSDATAGMNAGAGANVTLQRRVGTLSGGSCGSWGGYGTVINADGTLPTSYGDTLTSGNCYQYRLTVDDNVQNPTQVTGGEVRVDTTAPVCTLTLSENPDSIYQYVNSDTVYYNSAGTGTWRVAVTATDSETGINKVTFPTLGSGLTGGGDDSATAYQSDDATTPGYSFNGSSTYSSNDDVTCYNNYGLTATDNFTVSRDVAGPTYTTLTVNDGAGADVDLQTSTTTIEANFSFTGLADALSGIQRYDYRIVSKQGSCVDYYAACGETDDTVIQTWTDNGVSTTVSDAGQTLTSGETYAVQIRAVDNVENYSTIKASDGVEVDNTAPTCTVSGVTENPASDYLHYSSSITTIFYRSTQAGAFRVDVTLTDANEDKVNFPAITSMTGSGDDSSSPYQSTGAATAGYSFLAGTNQTSTATVTCYDIPGNSATDTFDHKVDDTAPSGGSVTYIDGVTSLGSQTVTFDEGLDNFDGAGITGAIADQLDLERDRGVFSGGACGSWEGWTSVGTFVPGSTSYNDTDLDNGKCYRYRLVVKDNISNSVTYTSPNETQVDSVAPSCSIANISDDSTQNQVNYNGGTLYYNPTAAGGFNVVVTVTDDNPVKVNFPTIAANFTGNGDDTDAVVFQSNDASPAAGYSFNTSATGDQSPTFTCYDIANQTGTVSLSMVMDTTAPTGGSISHLNGYTPATTLSVTFDEGTDAGAGITQGELNGIRSVQIQRDEVDLNSGSCDPWGGSWTDVGTQAPGDGSYLDSGLQDGKCYRYRVVVYDNVNNQAIFTSTDVTKVDQTVDACSVAALGEMDGGGGGTSDYVHVDDGSLTAFYNPLAPVGHGFDIRVSITDDDSGADKAAFETLGDLTGGGDDTSSPYSSSGATISGYAVAGATYEDTGTGTYPVCYDQAGSFVSSSNAVKIDRDVTAPVITAVNDGFAASDLDSLSDSTALPVNWAVSDSESGMWESTVKLFHRQGACIDADGGCGESDDIELTSTTTSGTSAVFSQALTYGETYYFEVTAKDNVSNESTDHSDGFIYDNLAPVVRLTERGDFDTALNHATAFAGTDTVAWTYDDPTDGLVDIEYYVDANDNCLADDAGSSWLPVSVSYNVGGSISRVEVSMSWDLDGTIPPPGHQNTILRILASDDLGNSSTAAYDGGTNEAWRCLAGGQGISLNYNPLPTVDITEVGGDASEDSVEYSTSSPAAYRWVTNDNTPTIKWDYADPSPSTAQSKFRVEIFREADFDATGCATTVTDTETSSATQEWTVPAPLADGRYIVRVKTWDSGTPKAESEFNCDLSKDYADSFMVDTAAPVISSIQAWQDNTKSVAISESAWVAFTTAYFEITYAAGEDNGVTESYVDCNAVGASQPVNQELRGIDWVLMNTDAGIPVSPPPSLSDSQVQHCTVTGVAGVATYSYSSLAEDPYVFTALIRDHAGNYSTQTFAFGVDYTNPTAPSLVKEDVDNDGVDDALQEGSGYKVIWVAGTDSGGVSHYEIRECSITDSSATNFNTACQEEPGFSNVMRYETANSSTELNITGTMSDSVDLGKSRVLSNSRYLYKARTVDFAGKVSAWTAWSDGSPGDPSNCPFYCEKGIVWEDPDLGPNLTYEAYTPAASDGSDLCKISGSQSLITVDVFDMPENPIVNSAIREVKMRYRNLSDASNFPANTWGWCDYVYTAGLPSYTLNDYEVDFGLCVGSPAALSGSSYLVQVVGVDGLNNIDATFSLTADSNPDNDDIPYCVYDTQPPVSVVRVRNTNGNPLKSAVASESATTLTTSYYYNQLDQAQSGDNKVQVEVLVFDPASSDSDGDWQNEYNSALAGSGLGTGSSGEAANCDLGEIYGAGASLRFRLDPPGGTGTWRNALVVNAGENDLAATCEVLSTPPNTAAEWLSQSVNVSAAGWGINAVLISFSVTLSEGYKLTVESRATDRMDNLESATNGALGSDDSNVVDWVWMDTTPPLARLVVLETIDIGEVWNVTDYSNSFTNLYNAGLYTPYALNGLRFNSVPTTAAGCTNFDPNPGSTGCGAWDGATGIGGYILSYARYSAPTSINQLAYNPLTLSTSGWVPFGGANPIPSHLLDSVSGSFGATVTNWRDASDATFSPCTDDTDLGCAASFAEAQGQRYCFVAQAVDLAGNVQDLNNYLDVNENISSPASDMRGHFVRTNEDQRWRERCVTIGAPGAIVDNITIAVPGLWTNDLVDASERSIERVGPRQKGSLRRSWVAARTKKGTPGF